MIKFSVDQENRSRHRDCRVWTELMVDAWYTSDSPIAIEYPATLLVADLRSVYFLCQKNNLKDVQSISYLGFAVLRANMRMDSKVDLDAIVTYFCEYARVNNAEFAQRWIEIYLKELV